LSAPASFVDAAMFGPAVVPAGAPIFGVVAPVAPGPVGDAPCIVPPAAPLVWAETPNAMQIMPAQSAALGR
jgi:hypothetical protein